MEVDQYFTVAQAEHAVLMHLLAAIVHQSQNHSDSESNSNGSSASHSCTSAALPVVSAALVQAIKDRMQQLQSLISEQTHTENGNTQQTTQLA